MSIETLFRSLKAEAPSDAASAIPAAGTRPSGPIAASAPFVQTVPHVSSVSSVPVTPNSKTTPTAGTRLAAGAKWPLLEALRDCPEPLTPALTDSERLARQALGRTPPIAPAAARRRSTLSVAKQLAGGMATIQQNLFAARIDRTSTASPVLTSMDLVQAEPVEVQSCPAAPVDSKFLPRENDSDSARPNPGLNVNSLPERPAPAWLPRSSVRLTQPEPTTPAACSNQADSTVSPDQPATDREQSLKDVLGRLALQHHRSAPPAPAGPRRPLLPRRLLRSV